MKAFSVKWPDGDTAIVFADSYSLLIDALSEREDSKDSFIEELSDDVDPFYIGYTNNRNSNDILECKICCPSAELRHLLIDAIGETYLIPIRKFFTTLVLEKRINKTYVQKLYKKTK